MWNARFRETGKKVGGWEAGKLSQFFKNINRGWGGGGGSRQECPQLESILLIFVISSFKKTNLVGPTALKLYCIEIWHT